MFTNVYFTYFFLTHLSERATLLSCLIYFSISYCSVLTLRFRNKFGMTGNQAILSLRAEGEAISPLHVHPTTIPEIASLLLLLAMTVSSVPKGRDSRNDHYGNAPLISEGSAI